MSQLSHFFSTPILALKDNHYDKRSEALIEECYQWREEDKDKGIHRSNQGGWHSHTKIFQENSRPAISIMNKTMIQSFNQATNLVAPEFDISKMDMKGEGWVNINPQHSFNVPHDHPGYTWSGVYYIKVPTSEVERSGYIEFLDPRTSVSAFSPELSKQSEYFSPKRTLRPYNGLILIFPSYLRHWVYPNQEDGDRITAAFNFKYAPKQDPNALLSEAHRQAVAQKKNQKGPKPNKGKK